MPLDDTTRVRCLRNRAAALEKRNKILSDKVKLLETQLQKMKETAQMMREEKAVRIEAIRCPVCLEQYSETVRSIVTAHLYIHHFHTLTLPQTQHEYVCKHIRKFVKEDLDLTTVSDLVKYGFSKGPYPRNVGHQIWTSLLTFLTFIHLSETFRAAIKIILSEKEKEDEEVKEAGDEKEKEGDDTLPPLEPLINDYLVKHKEEWEEEDYIPDGQEEYV